MSKRIMNLAIAYACLTATAFAGNVFPRVNAENFDGKAVVLPDAVKGKPAIFILSFSRSAEETTRGWETQLKQRSFPVDRYQLLELEDVPRFFRGMAKGGIRKSIPADRHASFFLLFEGQDALKKVTNFEKDSDAYILLLDATGNIVWQQHGPVDDQKLDALMKQPAKK